MDVVGHGDNEGEDEHVNEPDEGDGRGDGWVPWSDIDKGEAYTVRNSRGRMRKEIDCCDIVGVCGEA